MNGARAKCPQCGQEVAVLRSGRLRNHKVDEPYNGRFIWFTCTGSGCLRKLAQGEERDA